MNSQILFLTRFVFYCTRVNADDGVVQDHCRCNVGLHTCILYMLFTYNVNVKYCQICVQQPCEFMQQPMFRVMMVVVHLIYMFVFMLNSYLFSVFCFQKGFHHSAIILVIIFVHCGRFMCCFKGIISIFSQKMSHICFIFWAPFSALFCFINAHIWLCGRLF